MENTEIIPPDPSDLGDEENLPLTSESVADRLRRQRKSIAEQKTTDLDIPGYHGDLFCRYKLLDGADLDRIIKRARQTSQNRADQMLHATLDNLITACQEFYLRDEGREFPLREHPDAKQDLPVRYDQTLAEFMMFADELPSPPTARSVVLAVFGGNDIAVSAHGARLAQWMMRSGAEVDELLGDF